MMIRRIEIHSKSFVQTKMNYGVQRARRRKMTIQFIMVFFVDDLIHFFQALPVFDECSLLSLPNEHRPPTIMTKFSFFSVITPPVKT